MKPPEPIGQWKRMALKKEVVFVEQVPRLEKQSL